MPGDRQDLFPSALCNSCNRVQDLAQAAILASSPAMAAGLRKVLAGLHQHKASAAVDGLLYRLYCPILFRGLQAANGAVRLNALQLLVDAFPLQVYSLAQMRISSEGLRLCSYLGVHFL